MSIASADGLHCTALLSWVLQGECLPASHLLVDLGGRSGVKKASPPGSRANGDAVPFASGACASLAPVCQGGSAAAEEAREMWFSCTLKGLALDVGTWVGELAACCRAVAAAGARH